MMPGENHSKTAGIASDAAGSCQNCTSLQQNLNEYVAALIALKQKIIDSDHLLAEYQQKCDDLKDADRENKTLRCQLEQILQKISPGEQTEEQLKSLRVELEEKTSSLDVVQPSHLQFIRAKEACKKCNMAKKKHAAKIKKIEENASKHIKNIKRLQQEKRIIERELKKIQKKLEDVQNKKTVNNAQTQVANDQPVVELDKKKIRILLEEIWGCIESSAENGDGDKLFLETNLRKGKDFNPDNSIPSLSHFSSTTLTCKFETSESTVINISNDSAKCTESNEIYTCTDAVKEYTGDKPNLTETSAKDVFVLQKLNDSHLINSNHESDMEELLQIMNWAKPLPHILSPLRFSPLTTKCVFGGEITDSSDESSEEKNKAMDCTTLENKLTYIQDHTSFSPCPEMGTKPENFTQSFGFERDVKSDSIPIAAKTEIDKKDIEMAPIQIKVSSGGANNTLITNGLTEQSLAEKENTLLSVVNRSSDFEEASLWSPKLNVKVRQLSSINDAENKLLKPSFTGTLGGLTTILENPVGTGDFSGTLVNDNLHCTEDGLSSERCNLSVNHNPSENASKILFTKDSSLHSYNIDEMCSNEHETSKYLQVYNINSPGENDVHDNITIAGENGNLSVDTIMDNSNVTNLDRGHDDLPLSIKPETCLNEFSHKFSKESKDFKDSKLSKSCFEDVDSGKSDSSTLVNVKICFADETGQLSLDELKEKSEHSSNTPVVEFGHTRVTNQDYTDKVDKVDSKCIQELSVQKASISLEQKLPFRGITDVEHCHKAKSNELDYSLYMPASTVHAFRRHKGSAKTQFNLDSSTENQENNVPESSADRNSICLSMKQLEVESREKIHPELQTNAFTKDSKHDADESGTIGKCHIVTEQCKKNVSETVQSCSSDENLCTPDSLKLQKATVAGVQPFIETQLDSGSQSQAIDDPLCSVRHDQSNYPNLLPGDNPFPANFDTANADECLNKQKCVLTEKDMPLLSNQQFVKASMDLITESRDQLDTINKNVCKNVTPQNKIHNQSDSTLEKTGTDYSLQSDNDTLPITFNQPNVAPVVPVEKQQHFNIPSKAGKVLSKITEETDGNQDACTVSLNSSEEDNFLIRKVSYSRAVSSKPESLKKYCKNSTKSIEEKACNVHFELSDAPCKPVITDMECGGDLSVCVSENVSDSLKADILLACDSLVTAGKNMDPEDGRNSKNNVDQYSCEKETVTLDECQEQKEKLVSENIQCNNPGQLYCNTIENETKKTLPGKNLIWNFERMDDSINPRIISGKSKLKSNVKMVHGGSENSFPRTDFNTEKMPKLNRSRRVKHADFVSQTVTKESHQQNISHVEHNLLNKHVGETVLANADTLTNLDHSPETIIKVRSEMGPPLPPLLGPLLATPPKSIHPLSPMLSSSSCSSLPSPLDDFISPLPGTPFPQLVSPLSDGHRQKSLVLTTLSAAERANRRILSSPLQFCAATPKHALPVPGRLPLSASSSSSTSVQENSVKILDTMYPELSARARTINILKGNVQLNRGLPRDGENVSVSKITGFKSIASTSTAFIKTGGNSKIDSSKDKLIICENQQQLSGSIGSSSKRTSDSFLMPKSAKRLRLDTESPVIETMKNSSSESTKNDIKVQECQESCHNISYCELLPDVVKDGSIDGEIITKALKKIEDLCFDLLPVIRSHIFVGTIPKVPVMRNEEKEVIYEFSNSKKNLADSFLQVVLKKIKTGKRSMATTFLQALCRVYVGLCRQLGDIERARILCYSILKEDFPDPDRLLLFIVSSWNDIISTHGVVSKAIQAVLKNLAKDDVATCLSAYLNWEKTPPMNVTVLLSSVLMAVQLCPDGKFQQSEKYGEDLTDSIWEYIFAVDLLCSHRKWVWTHDKIISKELWPLLDKWVKRKKGNPNVSFISDLIVATVLRLVGHLCQMGIKEGYVTAVKNIGAVITAFLQHANDEGMSWGVQLACVYMLFDLAPSDPAAIYRTLQAWKESAKSDIPPAVVSCMQELESMCGPRK